MLTSGDVLEADLGEPVGREAGFPRPVIVVTAQVVTRTRRGFRSEIDIDPDERNGITEPSAAQCQHLRAVSTGRLTQPIGNVGVATLAQLRETIADLLDL